MSYWGYESYEPYSPNQAFPFYGYNPNYGYYDSYGYGYASNNGIGFGLFIVGVVLLLILGGGYYYYNYV
ncbi:hypothetical protein [Radiobacillus sp. PE A8.2]|uniref:hypothetical protein n=1 Tax=Radiobacillus sp. PE A8.2 TaxID=3380349 RepID=UPI00389059DD